MSISQYIESVIFKPPQKKNNELYLYPTDISESKEEQDLLTPLCQEIHNATGVPCICALPRNEKEPLFWIVYSHGNSENLMSVGWFLRELANVFQCAAFAYEYPGYYKKIDFITDKQIKPSQNGTFANADKFVGYMEEKSRREKLPVVLLGYSLGTAPTLHAAEKHKKSTNGVQEFPSAVILLAPFVSAASVVLAPTHFALKFTPLWQPIDVFCLRHSALVQGHPLLVVCGGMDDVVPAAHGEMIANIAGKHAKTTFILIPDANHASLRLFVNTWLEVRKFLEANIHVELPHIASP